MTPTEARADLEVTATGMERCPASGRTFTFGSLAAGRHAQALRLLLEENAALRGAVEQGAIWFEEYRELHLAKSPPDHAKAVTNGMRAMHLRASLSQEKADG